MCFKCKGNMPVMSIGHNAMSCAANAPKVTSDYKSPELYEYHCRYYKRAPVR